MFKHKTAVLVIPRNPGWEARVLAARQKGVAFMVVCEGDE